MLLRLWRLKKMESKGHTGLDQTTRQRNCPNCYYPLPRFGQYCSHCGQKYTDGRITVMSLIRQFMADSFNFDAKIWRTIGALFVPGKLTKTFFEGKQQRYLRPLRLFFVFAILTVAAVNFFEAEFAQDFFIDIDDAFESQINYSAFLEHLDTTTVNLKDDLPADQHHALDSLMIRMTEDYEDSLGIGVRINLNATEEQLTNFQIAKKDIADLPIDTLLARYEVTNFFERLIIRQNIRLQNQGENFAAYMLNQTIWMMMLIMPLLALFLKFLYVRRPYYYVEHLIFSFHVHSFLFFVLIVLMLLDNYPAISDQMGLFWIGGLVVMEFYFYKSLRNVYQQSRFKTVLKFGIMNFLYAIVFLVALILTVIAAALSY